MKQTVEYSDRSSQCGIVWDSIDEKHILSNVESVPLRLDRYANAILSDHFYLAQRNAQFHGMSLQEVGYQEIQNLEFDPKVRIDFPLAVRIGAGQIIPYAIVTCWEALRRSGLGVEPFRTLVDTAIKRATARETRFKQISESSLRAFLAFWRDIASDSADPEIALNPKGYVQAEWLKDDSNHLVMEFQPTGEIFFSLWLDGDPIEGIKKIDKRHELIKLLQASEVNPFGWCEV